VVAVGGGHGLAASLRAGRLYAGALTGIVSVADDGGSSGRLRRQLGIVPPGDLRKCLVALADDEALLAQVFEERFDADADELTGHALGNLIIAGLMACAGDVQVGLDEAARLLGVSGRIVPAATEPVVLKASSEGGDIEGQTAVAGTAHIGRVSVIPADARAPQAATDALAAADQIVIGPGSLFTSVLAAVAVPGIAEGIRRATAAGVGTGRPRTVYVANLRPEPAETEGFDVADHVAALVAHGITVDAVVADTTAIALGSLTVPVFDRPLAKSNGLAHDPVRLASALAGLVN
jgi:uncharacterized cofD-like protein